MNKKEARIPKSSREKLQTPRNMHGLIGHLITEIKRSISGRANPGSSETT